MAKTPKKEEKDDKTPTIQSAVKVDTKKRVKDSKSNKKGLKSMIGRIFKSRNKTVDEKTTMSPRPAKTPLEETSLMRVDPENAVTTMQFVKDDEDSGRQKRHESGNKQSPRKRESVTTTKKHKEKAEDKEETVQDMDELDDEGESKLIQLELKTERRANKEQVTTLKKVVTPRVKKTDHGNKKKDNSAGKNSLKPSTITMYDKGEGVSLIRLSILRELDGRAWEGMNAEYKTDLKVNPEVNRDTRYVIKFNVPPDGDFYDANMVEIPGIESKFIIAAAPLPDAFSRENFWRMVYDANVMSIVYLQDFKEDDKFVPWRLQESKDFGKINVLNKKTIESKKEGMQSILEVLPEGCSNSILVRFLQCLNWPEKLQLDKKFSSLNHPLVFLRLLKEDKGRTMVVCSNGLGRSAMFVILHSALTTMNNSNPVPIHQILAKLRKDRFGAIQTFDQLLTVYQLYLYYIAAKSGPKDTQHSNLCKKLFKSLSILGKK